MCLFFFSSRRRHTRLQGDWSSDVCSSDLAGACRKGGEDGNGGKEKADETQEPSRPSRPSRPSHPLQTHPSNSRFRASTSRSEERRVGEEGRSRWAPDHLKKKKKKK